MRGPVAADFVIRIATSGTSIIDGIIVVKKGIIIPSGSRIGHA